MPTLLDTIKLGAIGARNRILMAPLTRGRATAVHLPTPIMADYYRQRASAGLIITEATGISREGLSWPYAPGLWSDEQFEAWKPVSDAVHAAGGRIVTQLWHMGRLVHSSMTGQQPVSSSATTPPAQAHTHEGKKNYEQARALALDLPLNAPDFATFYTREARGYTDYPFVENRDGITAPSPPLDREGRAPASIVRSGS